MALVGIIVSWYIDLLPVKFLSITYECQQQIDDVGKKWRDWFIFNSFLESYKWLPNVVWSRSENVTRFSFIWVENGAVSEQSVAV